jgi:sugar lactone lactonase YvrE
MRALVCACLALLGCGGTSLTGTDVELTINTGPSVVPDADLASITTLEITISGAQSDHKSIALGRPMARVERIIVHLRGLGTDTLGVLARDAQSGVVCLGSAMSPVGGSSVHTATVTMLAPANGLHAMTPLLLGPSSHVQLFTGQTVPLTANMAVNWSVPPGGTAPGNVDASGLYTAGGAAGNDRVSAASQVYFGVYASVMVDVYTTGVLRYAGLDHGAGTLDGTGAQARISYPRAMVFDGAGNAYFTDAGIVVRKLDPATGIVTTLAGTAENNVYADGTGAAAGFMNPWGLAYDSAQNTLYVADNNTIRSVPLGTLAVTTLAGSASMSGTMDGTGAAASFRSVEGLVGDGNGHLYVSDTLAHNIREVDYPSGKVTTIAGVANMQGYADGPGGTAKFNWPASLALDGNGGLFVGDSHNQLIRKIDLGTKMVSTLTGVLNNASGTDGGPGKGTVSYPEHLAYDGQGTLWSAEGILRKIDAATGNITSPQVAPNLPLFGPLNAVAVSPDGKLYLSGMASIERVDTTTFARTVIAGTSIINPPDFNHVNGSRWSTRFSEPIGICRAPDGTLYVRDNSSIRRLDASTGTFSSVQDGAFLGSYGNCSVATDGTIYFVANNGVMKVDASGSLVPVAGNMGASGANDGPLSTARFNCPQDLVAVGNVLYVADSCNNTIRAVDLGGGMVTTVAGTAGTGGLVDMPGAAARFNFPQGIASDGSGTLYVASNNAVRKIVIAGAVVSTLAGGDVSGYADGSGGAAKFFAPVRLTLDDSKQNLYVSDLRNTAIRKVTLGGVVTTVAGQPKKAYLSTGALPGAINEPEALAFTPAGDLLVAVIHEEAIIQIRLP